MPNPSFPGLGPCKSSAALAARVPAIARTALGIALLAALLAAGIALRVHHFLVLP